MPAITPTVVTPTVARLDLAPASRRRFVHSPLERCVCRTCGSHVQALALLQIVSGICGTCGGCDIVRLEAADGDPAS